MAGGHAITDDELSSVWSGDGDGLVGHYLLKEPFYCWNLFGFQIFLNLFFFGK